MKKTFLLLVPMFVAIAAVPAGYEHWTAEQFATHEATLRKAVKNGLAGETLGHWGNHLLLKSRREASSGQAELHETQADLLIVQSGGATIIVGGKVVGGKTSAPNEIRGTSIEGGEMPVQNEEPLKRELDDFVTAVREKRSPLVDGAQGRRALELATRIVQKMGSV